MRFIQIILALIIFPISLSAAPSESDMQKVEDYIIDEYLPNCRNTETDFDLVYCDAKVYFEADDVLNFFYNEARGQLSDQVRSELKGVQTAWRVMRDRVCVTSNQSGKVIDLQCAKETTVASISYLVKLSERPHRSSQIIDEYYEYIRSFETSLSRNSKN